MKIFIPVNKNDITANTSKVFGRAPYFYVFDASRNIHQFIENNAKNGVSGAGIKAAQLIVKHGANVLITHQCGDNVGSELEVADVKVYQAQFNDITNNLKAFLEGKLMPITFHPGYHKH